MALTVEGIAAALERVALPAAVVDLGASSDPLESCVVAANEACARLVGEAGATLVGRSLLEFTAPDRVEVARANMSALKTRLRGFEVLGRVVAQDGREFSAHYWARRLDLDGKTFAAIIVAPEDVTAHPLQRAIGADGNTEVGFFVTDHEWRIEYRSDGVPGVLGEKGASVGAPLLGSVHPSDAPDFGLAAIEAMTSRRAVIGRVRFSDTEGGWRDAAYLLAALDDYEPPRLGVVLGVPGESPGIDMRTRVQELEKRLRRIAMEVRSTDLLPASIETVPIERVRLLAELSGRQLEIVTRLLNGERVPAIAEAMYLSPSTVRNHLTAIFRKFLVHSQVELIAKLKSSPRIPE